MAMNLAKVEVVKEWVLNAKSLLNDVQGLLGFVNFYCCFIVQFARLAGPFNDFVRTNVP